MTTEVKDASRVAPAMASRDVGSYLRSAFAEACAQPLPSIFDDLLAKLGTAEMPAIDDDDEDGDDEADEPRGPFEALDRKSVV